MSIEIIEAGSELKAVVLNLALYYIHDFTEFIGFRCPDSGLFHTSCWEKYWSEPNRWAFLIRCDGEPAGFALVGPDGSQKDTQFDMGEFFIMRKFRKRGLGQEAAVNIFDRFRGRWEVRVVVQNKPALDFWRKVIDRYTGGRRQELPEPVKQGDWWDVVQTFDNSRTAKQQS
jgi:predicted acetyltransferase